MTSSWERPAPAISCGANSRNGIKLPTGGRDREAEATMDGCLAGAGLRIGTSAHVYCLMAIMTTSLSGSKGAAHPLLFLAALHQLAFSRLQLGVHDPDIKCIRIPFVAR